MACQAPGENTSGAVRRGFLENKEVPVGFSDRHLFKCHYQHMIENEFHQQTMRAAMSGTITQHLSGIGVEGGRLGEVVSLVGDCRPPPPGNPHRPPIPGWVPHKVIGHGVRTESNKYWEMCLSSKLRALGGIIFLILMHFSFNNKKKLPNLKDLNSIEYFKKNHSYYSCTENNPMLKFGSFTSHLCGLMGVKPLPIAITNVLET